MKQMTCSAMGGPATCNHEITGNTAEEMAENGSKHLMEAHADSDMVKDMQNSTQEDKDKWMAEFKPKFDAAPEM